MPSPSGRGDASATVAIVGGGPVGLSAALLCARAGLDAVVFEKHLGTSVHPKARGVTIRTMELFRQWGIEQEVRRSGVPPETRGGVTFTSTLADPGYRYIQVEDLDTTRRLSPTTGAGCPQDHLEAVLDRAAGSLPGIQIRYGEEVVGLRQDDEGVDLETVDRNALTSRRLRAQWVIGADGARSTVRHLIGSELEGSAALSHNVNILFEADLTDVLSDHPSRLYWIANPPHVTGVVAPIHGYTRWLLNVVIDPSQADSSLFDDAHCADLVRHAAGLPDLRVKVLGAAPWTAAAQVASRWQVGRVLLAGDAAHLLPPYGGFGMNTGIQDVHNLVWKIAGVAAGWGGPALVDSYEAERAPVARWTIDQSLARMRTLGASRPNVSDEVLRGRAAERVDGIVFGYRYEESPIITYDGTGRPAVVDPASDYVPEARPGGRAPHVVLRSKDRSPIETTLDLFDERFTVLARVGGSVSTRLEAVAQVEGVPVRRFEVGADLVDPGCDFDQLYAAAGGDAVLIRPDGFVAGRCAAPAADAAIAAVVRTAAGRAAS